MTTREALILVIDEIAELRGIALAALAESDAERSTPQNRVPPNRPIKQGRGGGAPASHEEELDGLLKAVLIRAGVKVVTWCSGEELARAWLRDRPLF